MLFTDPNKGSGRLTKPEREDIGSIMVQQGVDPRKEVGAIDVFNALLMKHAAKADETRPGQTLAAQRLLRDLEG